MATIEERKAILTKEIVDYVDQGWRVISQTDTTAQLSKDKRASCLVAILLAILFILPAVLYLLFYRGTENCFLEVTEDGRVIKH
jgi:TRAP-type mannitol/chloroaromatic compound transport system permease small subunit